MSTISFYVDEENDCGLTLEGVNRSICIKIRKMKRRKRFYRYYSSGININNFLLTWKIFVLRKVYVERVMIKRTIKTSVSLRIQRGITSEDEPG